MKLALAFLFGFVLVKCQPQVYNLNPKFFNPLVYSGPRALNSPSPYYVQNPQYGAIFFNPLLGSLGNGGFQEHEENESRYNLNNNKLTSGDITDRDLIGVPRLFLNFANTVSSVSPVGQFLLRTVISTTLVTTTIASVSKCIPATEFAEAAPTPCARRRREVAEFLDRLALFDDGHETTSTEALAPSAIEKVQTTAFVTNDGPATRGFQPSNLLSSKEEEAEIQKRTKRLFNLLAVTTTITSYSFVTSVVNKQFNLITAPAKCDGGQAANPSCLLCLPPGFGVCT